MRRLFLTIAAIGLLGSVANAQTVTCPTTGKVVSPTALQFTASPDHNTTQASTGTAYVTNYATNFWLAATGAPVTSIDDGKPAPAGNVITITNMTLIRPPALQPEVLYCATVSAIGPGGSAASAPSNPFIFPGTIPPPGAPGTPAAKP